MCIIKYTITLIRCRALIIEVIDVSQSLDQTLSFRKHTYSNKLKNLPPKNETFQIKTSGIFHACSKHRLWVLDRTASPIPGGSNEYPQSVSEQK